MAEGTAELKVTIAGAEVKPESIGQMSIDMDIDQPDMCSITLNNSEEKYSETVKLADAVEVVITTTGLPEVAGAGGGAAAPTFSGEVVGLEPIFDVGGETKLIVRAFSKLHRLTRKRYSKTFTNMTDSAIFQQIAQAHGLTAQVAGDVNITHKHVYLHDLTDLEFLHQRARRINYELVFEGQNKVHFRKRDMSKDSGIKLEWGKEGDESLQWFKPRMSSAQQVTDVTVRGWDSLNSKVITGKAASINTTLGKTLGSAETKSKFGATYSAAYELPVYSQEEANAAAQSLLEDHALSYIVGEGQAKGDPKLKCGIVVTIETGDARFNGQYYLTGVSHRYTHKSGGPQGGYLTLIRFRRNAQT